MRRKEHSDSTFKRDGDLTKGVVTLRPGGSSSSTKKVEAPDLQHLKNSPVTYLDLQEQLRKVLRGGHDNEIEIFTCGRGTDGPVKLISLPSGQPTRLLVWAVENCGSEFYIRSDPETGRRRELMVRNNLNLRAGETHRRDGAQWKSFNPPIIDLPEQEWAEIDRILIRSFFIMYNPDAVGAE